jgi:hypothetical protein
MMNRRAFMTVICGVAPPVIIHLAYWLNQAHGAALDPAYICNPYLEGCVSTSRAVRSGPGLIWFKALMLPLALLLALTWRGVGEWMDGFDSSASTVRRWTVRLGIGGAIALVFYVLFLGTDGPVYSWLRRYGVVFFFGFTALAQLCAARFVLGARRGTAPAATAYIAVVSLQWVIGVFSVLKGFYFTDAGLIDRLQNITEWLMIGAMSLGFIVLGMLLGDREPTR